MTTNRNNRPRPPRPKSPSTAGKQPRRGPAFTFPPEWLRGGDSNGPSAPLRSRTVDNTRRVLTCDATPSRLVETADPADRAHGVFGEDGLLIPGTDAAAMGAGKPRLIQARDAVRVGTRPDGAPALVSIDSAADGLAAVARRLAEAGIELGIDGPRRTLRTTGDVVQLAAARLGNERLRDLIRRRVRCDMTPDEAALERRASDMLAAAERRQRTTAAEAAVTPPFAADAAA